MSAHLLGAFATVAIVIIGTPGPDTVLTIRNTMRGGRRAGWLTALGVAVGQLIWSSAAACGVAAAFSASTLTLHLVQLCGGTYLIALGLQAACHAVLPSTVQQDIDRNRTSRSARCVFQQGLLSNLSNPKMAVFFTALLPQFTVRGQKVGLTMLSLGVVFAWMTLVWLLTCAAIATRSAKVLGRGPVRRAMDASCACVFIALGVRIAMGDRLA